MNARGATRIGGNGGRLLGNRNQVQALVGSVSSFKRDLEWWDRMHEARNPMRGLKMDRVVQLLDQARQGQFTDIQWTYYHIERRNPVLVALIKRRQAALLKLDWDIKIPEVDELPDGVTEQLAEQQRQHLEAAYGRLDNMREALRFLALAEFRGYSHLAIHRNPQGEATHLEPIDQWKWLRNGMWGDWLYNPQCQNVLPASLASDPAAHLDMTGFIVRECDLPIDEVGLPNYLRKNLAQVDWDTFLDIYGIPSGVVTMPEAIQSETIRTQYEELATKVANGGSGVLPFGATYVTNDQPRGVNPFREHLRYTDEELVLAGTGGKLTMLTESGSGTLAGGAHEDTWEELAEGEAADISEVFQRQFDARELDRAFPGKPHAAYFELAAKAKEDVDGLVKNVVSLKTAGYRMNVEELNERTGYNLEEPEPAVLPARFPAAKDDSQDAVGGGPAASGRTSWTFPAAGARNRAMRNRDAAALVALQLGVPRSWMQPVADVLDAMVAKAGSNDLTDADLLNALDELERRLPEVFGEMDHGALADVMRGAMGQAALEGAKNALATQAKG